MFDPPVLFSDVLVSCFLVLKGPTSRGRFSLRGSRSPFHTFFCIGFQTSFSTQSDPQKAQNRDPKQQQIIKIGKKIIIETHPQPRPAKRLRLGGIKPLKLTTLTTLSAVFPKARSSQSRAKKGPKWRLRATKITKQFKKEHAKKQ